MNPTAVRVSSRGDGSITAPTRSKEHKMTDQPYEPSTEEVLKNLATLHSPMQATTYMTANLQAHPRLVQETIDEQTEASYALMEHEMLPMYRHEVERTLDTMKAATIGLLARREIMLALIEIEESAL